MSTKIIRQSTFTVALLFFVLDCQDNAEKDNITPESDAGSDTETTSDSDSNVDTDTSTETNSDTDTDTETDGTCDDIDWGTECTVGEKVVNWYFTGFILPLMIKNEITLETIRCPGYKTLVVVAGDTACDDCLSWVAEIGDIKDEIQNANSVILTIWTDGGESYPTMDAFNAVDQAGLVPDFVTGDATAVPNDCNPLSQLPFSAVIDLRQGYLLGKDGESGKKMTTAEILNLVEGRNTSSKM